MPETVKYSVKVGGVDHIIELKNTGFCPTMYQQIIANKDQLTESEYSQLMIFLESQNCTVNT